MDVLLRSLTPALDRCQWSTSRSDRFIPGNEPRCPLNWMPSGPQSLSGRFLTRDNILSLPGFEPRPVQPVGNRYSISHTH